MSGFAAAGVLPIGTLPDDDSQAGTPDCPVGPTDATIGVQPRCDPCDCELYYNQGECDDVSWTEISGTWGDESMGEDSCHTSTSNSEKLSTVFSDGIGRLSMSVAAELYAETDGDEVRIFLGDETTRLILEVVRAGGWTLYYDGGEGGGEVPILTVADATPLTTPDGNDLMGVWNLCYHAGRAYVTWGVSGGGLPGQEQAYLGWAEVPEFCKEKAGIGSGTIGGSSAVGCLSFFSHASSQAACRCTPVAGVVQDGTMGPIYQVDVTTGPDGDTCTQQSCEDIEGTSFLAPSVGLYDTPSLWSPSFQPSGCGIYMAAKILIGSPKILVVVATALSDGDFDSGDPTYQGSVTFEFTPSLDADGLLDAALDAQDFGAPVSDTTASSSCDYSVMRLAVTRLHEYP